MPRDHVCRVPASRAVSRSRSSRTRSPRGLVVVALLTVPVPNALAGTDPEAILDLETEAVVRFDLSPPVGLLAATAHAGAMRRFPSGSNPGGAIDPVAERVARDPGGGFTRRTSLPELRVVFDGAPNLDAAFPADPVGAVGRDHLVVVNNFRLAVYDKSGGERVPPTPLDALWSSFGSCDGGMAYPTVLYDHLADRWLLFHVTLLGPSYRTCIALSSSGDPAGTYLRWAFERPDLLDAPTLGLWPNAYGMGARQIDGVTYTGARIVAFDRGDLLAGEPSPDVVSFFVPLGPSPWTVGDGLLPADLVGPLPPPAASPQFFLGSMDDGSVYGAPQDALSLWKLVVDFDWPRDSRFTLAAVLPVVPFDSMFPCSPSPRSCIPQPGVENRLDVLSSRQALLPRIAYRNFGSHESLVANQSVEAAPALAGIRWYELRDPNGEATIHQQGTHAPGVVDGVHRWNASLAMDGSGNLATGFSVSDSDTVFPGIRAAGRLESDPPGSLPRGEVSIVDGSGAQTGTSRWGSASSMSLDPVDDCTFWHVNTYVPETSSVGWRLRIGAFAFDDCRAFESVFDDGFESGDLLRWTASVPGGRASGGRLTPGGSS